MISKPVSGVKTSAGLVLCTISQYNLDSRIRYSQNITETLRETGFIDVLLSKHTFKMELNQALNTTSGCSSALPWVHQSNGTDMIQQSHNQAMRFH